MKLSCSLFFGFFLLFPSSGRVSEDAFSPPGTGDVKVKRIRYKRVFWGEPLLDPKSYDVMSYVVHITNGVCTWMDKGIYRSSKGLCEQPYKGSHMCGGALISEFFVQTACHCLVIFRGRNATHFHYLARKPWENQYGMYLGYYNIEEVKGGSVPRVFILHEKCKMMFAGYVAHDFGIIVTQKPLLGDKPFTKPAPLYSASELTRKYMEILREQRVCLMVGWGYAFYKTTWNRLTTSKYLQHTWSSAISIQILWWYEGYKFYDFFNTTPRPDVERMYKKERTWFGTRNFGKFSGLPGKGDSGSPVTCDAQFAGILSGSSKWINVTKPFYKWFYAITGSIRYSEFENAAEYRRPFLDKAIQLIRKEAKIDYTNLLLGPTSLSRGSQLCTTFNKFIVFVFFLSCSMKKIIKYTF